MVGRRAAKIHNAGFIHGDYKSVNVAMIRRGRSSPGYRDAKMIDFGHSKFSSSRKLGDYECGTRGYRPYEYSPRERYDTVPFTKQVDVFGLGIVFLECLEGELINTLIDFDDYGPDNHPREQLDRLVGGSRGELRPLIERMLLFDRTGPEVPSMESVVGDLDRLRRR